MFTLLLSEGTSSWRAFLAVGSWKQINGCIGLHLLFLMDSWFSKQNLSKMMLWNGNSHLPKSNKINELLEIFGFLKELQRNLRNFKAWSPYDHLPFNWPHSPWSQFLDPIGCLKCKVIKVLNGIGGDSGRSWDEVFSKVMLQVVVVHNTAVLYMLPSWVPSTIWGTNCINTPSDQTFP